MTLWNRRASLWPAALAVAIVAGTGCPGGGGDGDALPPDLCNAQDQALHDGQCALQQDTDHLDFISFANDQDWFSITTPSTMNARSLLRITGGYSAPATPVQLAINLLPSDGSSAGLGRVTDKHGQAPPKVLQLTTRFTQPDTQLVLKVEDQPDSAARPQSDARNPYNLRWTVLQDPDANEPNDVTPTPIALNGSLAGSGTGVLATQDDEDLFSINVPAAGRILYFHVGEVTPAPKPLLYRLAYTLFSPTGGAVAEGQVANEFDTVDLATARVTVAGTYKLSIHAYRVPNNSLPLPGDDRLTYKIDVLIVDQQDANEPNDDLTQANARAVSLATGSTRTFTGRIGSVGDPDWFAVDVPANNSAAQILHYKVLPPTGSGRFPSLPLGLGIIPDREVSVLTEVTQGTAACKTDSTLCPKGYGGNPGYQSSVEEICARTPAQCLWSTREEDRQYAGLKNFEGKIPITPHGTPTRYYVVVQDVGNNWADDRNYTLQVTLEADADDTARLAFPGQTDTKTLVEDTSGSTFPAPPAGASTLSGKLSFGYGRLFHNDPILGAGIRAGSDYDAVETDTDRYQLDIPFQDPANGPLDRTWELQWTVQHVNGAPPEDLFVDVELCDGTKTPTDGGTCSSVTSSRSGGGLVFAYDDADVHGWWNFNQGLALQPAWDQASTAGATTITARAYGCFCFEPRFIQGGKLFLRVGGIDRETWDEATYTVRTAFTAYPRSFAAQSDGGFRSCPGATAVDAGTLPDGGAGDAGPYPYTVGCDFTR